MSKFFENAKTPLQYFRGFQLQSLRLFRATELPEPATVVNDQEPGQPEHQSDEQQQPEHQSDEQQQPEHQSDEQQQEPEHQSDEQQQEPEHLSDEQRQPEHQSDEQQQPEHQSDEQQQPEHQSDEQQQPEHKSDEQQQPEHQSDELGFQTDQPTITDQLQALSVQHQEDEGDYSGSKEGESEVTSDDDAQQSWRSDDNGGHQSDEKQQSQGDIAIEENDDKSRNGDGDRDENGKGKDVEVRARKKVARKGTSKPNPFNVRPEAEKCTFYVRTGTCKFGMNCKFNHPPKKKPLSVKVKQKAKDDSSEKEAKINCKYHDQPGGCKYGKACKNNHHKHYELNFLGLPIRTGEKECSHYMRNGSCKYGLSCRFNHPDPSASEMSDTLPLYSNGGPVASQGGPQSPLAPWSPPAAMNDTASYMPLLFPPTQGVPSSSEWNSYQAPFYPYESMPISPAYTVNSPMLEANIYAQQQQMPVNEFSKRIGQPNCSHLRTGDSKCKSACKFHHPKKKVSKSPKCALSDLGLPLRPGQSICSIYKRYGICKFGPACKNDHPENYVHTHSSAASELNQSLSVVNSMNAEDAIGIGI